jgi:hypothetical protein
VSALIANAPPGQQHSAVFGMVDSALDVFADTAATYGRQPGVRAARSIDRLRSRDTYAIWIVLIVAIAVVAVVGIMAYVAVVCIRRGGSYAGGLSVKTNGWKVWEYKLQFKCSR